MNFFSVTEEVWCSIPGRTSGGRRNTYKIGAKAPQAAWRVATFLALIAGIPDGVLAQGRQLEEILVMAQKKSESLQDVPISISVLGADELSELAIFDFTETARLTPGVNMFPGVQSAAIRLRGVGPAFFALTSPQSVTVFVDEMAQASVGSVFSTLVDIERIELLRGPQGTLYGTNAPVVPTTFRPALPMLKNWKATLRDRIRNTSTVIWKQLIFGVRSIYHLWKIRWVGAWQQSMQTLTAS